MIRGHNLQGTHHRRQLGKGREFEKLREYEHGDSFEDIDWKATARRRSPVVKVFQIERTQEVYAVIDSSRLSARGNVLDSYVTAALTLAVTAESQHDRFGLASFSAGVDGFLPAAGGKRHFAFCRDAIYALSHGLSRRTSKRSSRSCTRVCAGAHSSCFSQPSTIRFSRKRSYATSGCCRAAIS